MTITINGSGDINATGNDIELNSTGTTDVTLAVGGGSVGVGVASPTATLDVNGTIKLDGNYPVGTSNVALGDTALDDASFSGANNVAVGHAAMSATTSGNFNSAVGAYSLSSNTTGSSNASSGSGALENNSTGSSNSAFGAGALTTNSTASNNTAVGKDAGGLNSTGENNTFLGKGAGYSVTSSSNTCVGHDAGLLITSGAKNTILGRYNGNQGGIDIRNSNNNIVLADGDGNPRQRITNIGHLRLSDNHSTMGNSGNKHITANNVTGNYIHVFEHSAASSNVYGLFVNFYGGSPNDNVRSFIACQDSTAARFYVRSNGNVVNANNVYGAISDEKLKENIVDSGSQWDDIKALRVRKYSLKADELDAPNKLGVIAQEVEAAGMSGLVVESPDQDNDLNDLGTVTKSVNYSVLYMKAVKALQEAMERIESLETANADMLARIEALEAV